MPLPNFGEFLESLGHAVCVGIAAWLGDDSYVERQQAKLALYAISQTGWRAPINYALKSNDPEVRQLAQTTHEELMALWPAELPVIMDLDPPAQALSSYRYWRAQRELHYLTYCVTPDYTAEDMRRTSQMMTANFLDEAIRKGCPPILLTECLRQAKPKPEIMNEYRDD